MGKPFSHRGKTPARGEMRNLSTWAFSLRSRLLLFLLDRLLISDTFLTSSRC